MRDRERYEAPPHMCKRPRPHLATEYFELGDRTGALEIGRHLSDRVRGRVGLERRELAPMRPYGQ